jgi:hypothetical protein
MLHELYAHEVLWRVVEVLWTHQTEDNKLRLVTGRTEYRKTYEGAIKLRDRWVKERGSRIQGAIVQGGIVTWYPDDELQAAWDTTDFTRTQNVDDRDEDRD